MVKIMIDELINDIIEREGGYVNHPADRGGPTNYGITLKSLHEFTGRPVTIRDIKKLSRQTAFNIYFKNYFTKPGINKLSGIIQPLMVDMAVNHGPVRAIKLLQNTLNQFGYYHQKIDGIIGFYTISATTKATNRQPKEIINRLVQLRKDFYTQIISNDPSQAVFENGWMARADYFRVDV